MAFEKAGKRIMSGIWMFPFFLKCGSGWAIKVEGGFRSFLSVF